MATMDVPAPMSGSIKELLVSTGDAVRVRQELLVLESMKMEIPVESPAAGTVTEILVSARQKIDEGQLLLRLDVG
jgi:pyruvate carboxylase subunit B